MLGVFERAERFGPFDGGGVDFGLEFGEFLLMSCEFCSVAASFAHGELFDLGDPVGERLFAFGESPVSDVGAVKCFGGFEHCGVGGVGGFDGGVSEGVERGECCFVGPFRDRGDGAFSTGDSEIHDRVNDCCGLDVAVTVVGRVPSWRGVFRPGVERVIDGDVFDDRFPLAGEVRDIRPWPDDVNDILVDVVECASADRVEFGA